MCGRGGGGLSLELAKRAGKGLERVIKGEGGWGQAGPGGSAGGMSLD